jgi:hypothetical protein
MYMYFYGPNSLFALRWPRQAPASLNLALSCPLRVKNPTHQHILAEYDQPRQLEISFKDQCDTVCIPLIVIRDVTI